MISVGAPWLLWSAVGGAFITCVLHFLSVRRPPVLLLPTMRFLPDRPVRAVSRSARPSDLLLMLLRVMALLLIGLALAGVTWSGGAPTHGRVVVVDRNVDTSDISALRARVSALLQARLVGDTATRFVVIDSTAHVLTVTQMRAFHGDTLRAAGGSTALSAMLLAGVRGASALVREERNVDSVELVLVAPFNTAMNDAAIPTARSMWPGNVRLVDLASEDVPVDSTVPRVKFVAGIANAAVLSAFGSRGFIKPDSARDASSSAASSPEISIEWPASGIPSGWTAVKTDTIGGLVARGRALVWPFVRSARAPDSLVSRSRAIAWWSDGAVAAIERADANACVRQVGVSVTSASDVLQGRGAAALMAALTAPCGVHRVSPPLSDELRKSLEGVDHAAPSSAFRIASATHTPYASMLLMLALLLLTLEWWTRDREGAVLRATTASDNRWRNVA